MIYNYKKNTISSYFDKTKINQNCNKKHNTSNNPLEKKSKYMKSDRK